MKINAYQSLFVMLATSSFLIFPIKAKAQSVYIPPDPNANTRGIFVLSLCQQFVAQAQNSPSTSPIWNAALSCQQIQNNYQLCLIQGAVALDPMYPIKCSEAQAQYFDGLSRYTQYLR
jgi:hypothetical protein